jgi:transcriptional regulator with XRE-family HTH domain
LTIPPPVPGSTVRDALAARLTALRTAAGLSGNALAKRMRKVQSRVWKIEHSELLPTEDDIRAWVEATGHDAETARELTQMLTEARSESATFAAAFSKYGAARYQQEVQEIEARSTRIGEFQIAMIPAILQTADYAREILALASGPGAWGASDADIETMINVRLRRQEALYAPGKRIQVVLGEAALKTLVCAPSTLIGQLEKLLSVMQLPSVELGIIGFSQRMPVFPFVSFSIRDDDLIIVEELTGEQKFAAKAAPDQVASYLRFFGLLRDAAVTGAQARSLITQALEDLDSAGGDG